jgi:enoyl-CoA hydratase/carnithine racemase
MSEGPLRVEVAEGIARLTLDRPEKRNALTLR